jgi:lipopolysaccharide transport system ATP-binding protein
MIRRSEVIMPGQPLVELRQVSKLFKVRLETNRSFQQAFVRLFRRSRGGALSYWSLRDIWFSVDQGDNVAIIGANGSGKSTLLKLIAGILEPTSGDIFTNGRIASLLELGAGFHPELTGRENIYLNGSVFGLSRSHMKQLVSSIIEFAELGDLIDMPIKHYSSGMYVRLGFAVAIHTAPDVLLVDEVLAVGDASFQHKCLDAIQKFRAQGGTLVLVTHDLETMQSLCNKAIWLDQGQVRAAGQPTDVAMAYLNKVADREDEAAVPGSSPEPGASGHRWGTGKIRISRVELCDGAGTPRRIFANGSTLEVHMQFRAEGKVEDPVFGIVIHHPNGTQICGPNTNFSGLRIPFVGETGRVIYRIPKLPLVEGAYQVSVAATDRADTETYDFHDRAYSFRVSPGASHEQYGLVTLGGEWSIEPDLAPSRIGEP